MQVIKNPVTDHLPTGCAKIGTSYHSDEMVDVRRLIKDEPTVFVVGAMAHGKVCSYIILGVSLSFLAFIFIYSRLKWIMLRRRCPLVAIHFLQL